MWELERMEEADFVDVLIELRQNTTHSSIREGKGIASFEVHKSSLMCLELGIGERPNCNTSKLEKREPKVSGAG